VTTLLPFVLAAAFVVAVMAIMFWLFGNRAAARRPRVAAGVEVIPCQSVIVRPPKRGRGAPKVSAIGFNVGSQSVVKAVAAEKLKPRRNPYR
jgi:hypothetical protein